MIPRYSRPDMRAIWTDENKLDLWLQIEMHASEALVKEGTVPKADLVRMKAGAKKCFSNLPALVKRQKKDYGIIIRRIGKKTRSNDGSHKVGSALEAYKVFRDGRQERIRNVQFSDISRSTFKDIIAVSKNMFAYNTMYQPTTPFFVQSGPSPMSIVLPESILFEDITIRPPDGEIPKPPVAKHPYFDQ